MPFVILVFPFSSEHNLRILDRAAGLPGVRLGVVNSVPQEAFPPELRAKIAGHWRIDDCLDPDQLAWAVSELSQRHGPVHRLFSPTEQVQVAAAEVRERFDIPGMRPAATRNFRDKARMKDILRAHGLPCARSRRVASVPEARTFANEIGLPLVLKPLEGAAAQATFQVETEDALRDALASLDPAPGREVIVEEFVQGEEHSCDTFTLRGQPLFHTVTDYAPTALHVMRNPWIQWNVVLPREVDDPRYDDIRAVAFRALEVLGMDTGLSHLEWFRRADGSVVVSEVGARPPGAQFTTLISRANDFDSLRAWVRLIVDEEFEKPERKYAAGAAYLRGQGRGCVRAVHGWEAVEREIHDLVTDARLPAIGQHPGVTYEGEGYVLVRHPETAVVEDALRFVVSNVRVELG
jgi:formate-dependent phosphoribosylglycinamide formyltransferase (GAR transformylase)